MATRMQQRKGTAAQWISTNGGDGPVLNAGEIGFESDTNKFKIGDGVNHWVDLTYFVDQSGVDIPEIAQEAINDALVAGTGLDKTYNDEANTITLDIDSTVATKTYADGAVSTHSADITNVHGISDTSLLATGSQVDSAVSNHNLDITNVHGITDTSLLATTSYVDDAISGIDALPDQTGNNGKFLQTNSGIASWATVDLSTKQDIVSGVSSTEIGYLDGVTSSIQTQIDGKSGTAHTHLLAAGATDVTATATELNTLDGITASTAELNILDGATLSTTELNYVDGVTSAIQTQLNAKASLAGAVFTGNVEVDGNLVVDGDLTVNGTEFNASSTSIVIEDNMVQLAHSNAANTVDLGIVVGYNDGAAKHSGIVRDVSADKWKLFKGVTTEPATTVDFTEGSLDALQVGALEATTVTLVTGDLTLANIPTQNLHAATKSYADAVSPALTWGQLKNGKAYA